MATPPKYRKHKWAVSKGNSALSTCQICEWTTSPEREDGEELPEGPCFGPPGQPLADLVEQLLPEHTTQAFHYSLLYREELKKLDARIAQLHSELRDLTIKREVIVSINAAADRVYKRQRAKRPYDD